MDEKAYEDLRKALKKMKNMKESPFDKKRVGEEIEINNLGGKRKD